MFIWLYFIFFFSWIVLLKKKYKLNISIFIVGLYFIGSICGLSLFYFVPDMIKHPERITLVSVISHIFLLWLFLYPLVRYGNSLRPENLKISRVVLKRFSWFIIIPSIIAILMSISDLIRIFAYSNLLSARNAFISGDISNLYVTRYGPIGYLISFGPQISFLATFFAFYYRFYLQNKSMVTTLLFISSLCMPINNLAIAGREGFIRWILFMIFCLIFFKDYIDFKKNKSQFLWLGVTLTAIIVIFMQISLDRFEDSKNGVFASLLRYGGEQFYLYSYNFHYFHEKGTQSVAQLFPLISQQTLTIYNQNKLVSVDYFLNTFSTFIGSFIKNVGFFNTLLICLGAFFLFFIAFWKSRRWEKYTITKITGFLFCYEIVLLGFFYYLHSGRFTQFTIIFYVILAYILSHLSYKDRFIKSAYPL